MCRRAVLLRRGTVVAQGDARDVVTQYQRSVTDNQLAGATSTPDPDLAVSIRNLRVLDQDGVERVVSRTGESFSV